MFWSFYIFDCLCYCVSTFFLFFLLKNKVEVKTERNNTHITAAIGSRAGRALQRHFVREQSFVVLGLKDTSMDKSFFASDCESPTAK